MSSNAETRPVTVIVLTWNGLEVTRACVSSILGLTTHPDFRVTVVDNASTDGTGEYLRGLDDISLIENEENLGFVKGNNAGIRAADTDVVLMNNDTEIIQGDWLEQMQRVAYSEPDIGVVGCRLVNAEGELVHAGTYMPVPSYWGQEYPGGEKDIGQYCSDSEVEGVIFACAYIKRELIEKVGALDEDYFSYYEDTDFCMKASQAGYRVFRCGAATVKHLENASTDLNRMDFSGTFRRSREVFMSKWKGAIDSRYGRSLTWHSCLSGEDMYSAVSCKILWALDRAGVDLNLGFLEGAERAELADFRINDMKNRGRDRDRPQVLFGPPDMLQCADGSYNIGYVSTPYHRFLPEWVKEINRLDELWVTSEFQRQAALDSGVKKDISVMPLGVDPDYFHPGIAGHPLEGRFVFLAPVCWGPGVASEPLLKAFTEEFAGDEKVVLVMNVVSPAPGAEVEQAVEALGLPFDRAPVVFVMDHDIPAYQAGSLYRSADCVVLAGREAEAGTAPLEALACGVPVVATDWGTMNELIDGSAAFGVESVQVPSPVEGMNWADPYYGKLRTALREVYQNSSAARENAVLASRRVRSERSWDMIASMMIARLDDIAGGR
jgi:GT2 family glycosyltransferase